MLLELTRIGLGCAIAFGPVVVPLSLLNRRHRRTSQWHDALLPLLPWHALRGFVGIQVRSGVLTRRSAFEALACMALQGT
jgi:hypothetical protein